MSPRNTVSFLRHLCLKIISNQLIYALSDDEGKYYQVVETYLSGATYEVLQELLNIILNSVNLDASIRFSCMELLLKGDVKKLKTGMFPQFYYEKILNTIARGNGRLEHLNLKGVWVRDFPNLLSDVIKNCQGLKILIIPHMANDEVLHRVSELKKLFVLDISGESCFTVKGIEMFRCDSLRVLDVGNYGKRDICQEEDSGPKLVATILQNVPNLEYFKIYSFTGHALHFLHESNPDFKTKLKYIHDTGTTVDTVRSIIKTSPHLEHVHLDTPAPGVIEAMSSLKQINTLKLSKCDIKEVQIFLCKTGDKIHSLTINNCKSSTLDISEICTSAPNLIKLECYKMVLSFLNPENYFMTLQDIELLYCDMPDHVVKYILTNAPFLKRFLVGSVINLTDGDIFRICAESDLSSLEELWFSYARCLTCTSVELLMGHCPNLRVIGQVDRWDLSQDDLDMLRIVIALTNSDLSLLPE